MLMFDSIEVDNNVATGKPTYTRDISTISIESIYQDEQRDQAFANIFIGQQETTSTVKWKIDNGAQTNVMPRPM